MNVVGIIWTLLLVGIAVIPAFIESRLKKAAKKGTALPIPEYDEPEPEYARRSFTRTLPSDRKVETVHPHAGKSPLDTVPPGDDPAQEGVCAVPHPGRKVVHEDAVLSDIDLEKMIIYSEILKPKYEDEAF
ncbi:MAG: hypothetical protein J6P46_07050 [Bacteroidales bacterium]|nr:hypothetical protein [Bacteroidales bacterium]